MNELLYRKCRGLHFLHNTTTITGHTRDINVYIKKVQYDKVLYGALLTKIADMYIQVVKKAEFFKETVEKIFED